MAQSILIPVNDSPSSRSMVDFFANLPISHEDSHITLIHVFRKPSASEELMGEEYMKEKQPAKMSAMLNEAKEKLIERGRLKRGHHKPFLLNLPDDLMSMFPTDSMDDQVRLQTEH